MRAIVVTYFLVSSFFHMSFRFLHKLWLFVLLFSFKNPATSLNPLRRQGMGKEGQMGEKSELSQYPNDCMLEACCCTTTSPGASLFVYQ